jgi:hypothetical protein
MSLREVRTDLKPTLRRYRDGCIGHLMIRFLPRALSKSNKAVPRVWIPVGDGNPLPAKGAVFDFDRPHCNAGPPCVGSRFMLNYIPVRNSVP